MDNEDDLFVEDLSEIKKGPKKIKSGAKGKRAERLIVKMLNERFAKLISDNPSWGGFSRSIGSGNRFGQKVQLSQEAANVFASDLVCPPLFKFSVESKCGYNEIDMCSLFDKGNKEIDSFLGQVKNDSKRVDKEPLLIWKKDRKPALAFFYDKGDIGKKFDIRMIYNEWTVVFFNDLLSMPDSFFFTI